jgi:Bacterial Ig-like domain (group 3)/FlgD Ig-like domain
VVVFAPAFRHRELFCVVAPPRRAKCLCNPVRKVPLPRGIPAPNRMEAALLSSVTRSSVRLATSVAAGLVFTAFAFGAAHAQATIDANSPATTISTAQTTAIVPVTVTRSDNTSMLAFSVTFTLAGGLTKSNVTIGPFLSADGASTDFHVIDHGGGNYTADGVTLGTPCGSTQLTGTLFNIVVASTAPSGTGTVTINSVILRDCSNATLSSAIGSSASVNIDNTAPDAAVTSPNGGEFWIAGSSHNITWTASDDAGVSGVDLEYSTNNGGSWTSIATNLPNSGSYAWTVPAVISTAALVRITARDTYGNARQDASDADFTIGGATSTTLTIDVSPSVYLDPIQLTATVAAIAPAPGTPTGTVTFYDGASSIGTGTLDGSGVAVLSISSLAVGTHTLKATYATDGSYATSTSSDVAHEVKAKIVATSSGAGSLNPPGTTLYSLNATPAYTFVADPGNHVQSVTVDGSPAPLTSPYTFGPVTVNHTIDVQFTGNPSVPAITTLASQTVKAGNDASGIEKIKLTWTALPVGSAIAVYRAKYGNYPEYDDAPNAGSVPVAPSYPPGAAWTLTSIANPNDTDLPPAPDFWYYVAFVTDQYGTRSPVSNLTSGSLDYALGDVSNGSVAGQGDNLVNTLDISLLGAAYGQSLAPNDAHNYLDVGPTTDFSVNARPTTDNQIDFEDLVVFALNFGNVSAPMARLLPQTTSPSGHDQITLEVPQQVAPGADVAVSIRADGSGSVHAISTKLSWDPAIVAPSGYAAGNFLLAQNGVAFSARPGSVDAAVLGSSVQGLIGSGELASVRFHVIAAGDPKISIASLDARDADNHKLIVPIAMEFAQPLVPQVTRLGFASPSPFTSTTSIAFGLSKSGPAELAIFSVDGRHVRTLAQGNRDAGEYHLTWDGRDSDGRMLSPGLYYVRLVTSQGQFTRKLTFLR